MKEFFEAFGIEPTRKSYFCSFDYGDCPFDDRECETCSHYIYQTTAKPITPEIVLELEEIILDKYHELSIQKSSFISGKYKACTKWNKSTIEFDKYAFGKTKEKAVLSLCIQLQPEIQTQVKELFNDK